MFVKENMLMMTQVMQCLMRAETLETHDSDNDFLLKIHDYNNFVEEMIT